MAWVIAVLGAALAAGGGVALWNGSGYIRLDWGQAQTVAGTVALSAGVVTIALAAVLFKLRDAVRALAGQTALATARPSPAAAPAVAGTAAGVGLEAVHLDDEPDPASVPGQIDGVAAPDSAPARGRIAGRLARVGVPKPERAEPGMTGAVAPSPAEAEPAYDPRPRAVPAAVSMAVPEAPRPSAPAVAEAPTVVGRYEANGASYVLFSDGTIEVETEGGTHRFASMADLKDHIERQDAG